MKKLFALFIVALLVCMLALPVSAAEDYSILDGYYKFKDHVDFGTDELHLPISFSTVLLGPDGIVSETAYSSFNWFYNPDKDYVGSMQFGYTPVYSISDGWLGGEKDRIVYFDNVNLKDLFGELWYAIAWQFTSNAYPVCIEDSCSGADANKDNFCDDCGFEFAVLRVYEPFTVAKFMSNIGQIFTSAVSWVGYVGSTILQQPLLLAFTALPLCGLGIAVFRRLKNTV